MTPDLSYEWEGEKKMCKDNEWDEKKKEKKKKKKSKAEQCKANRAEQRSTAKHRKQEQIKSRVKQGKVA